MEETIVVAWLNTVCAGFDYRILDAMHSLALWGGGFLTPFFFLITLVGEQGILMFGIAVIGMVFKRTRKAGVCVFVAVCIGAVITNVVLKDFIARPRPFEEIAFYQSWWEYVGSPEEAGYSFPSGHVTAATSGALALVIVLKKPATLLALLYVLLTALSRIYLMAHYPTDVIAAIIVGTVAAILSVLLVNGTLSQAEKKGISWINKMFPSNIIRIGLHERHPRPKR